MGDLQIRSETTVETDLPEGYGATKLGPLPEDWQALKLEEIIEFTRKPRGLRISDFPEVPFIPMESIPADGTFGCSFVLKSGGSISSGTYCEPGDILLAKITPSLENGKQGIVPAELPDALAMATTEVYPLKPKLGLLDRDFLFFYLLYGPVRRDLASKMEGSTGRQRLPKHVLSNLLVPLPRLPEQRAIAHILSTIQKAKEATEQVIEASQELKRSLMNHLFTYGPVPVDEAEQVPLKKTEIGPIPEHWEVVELRSVITKGKQLNPGKTPDWKFNYIDVSGVSRENLRIQNYTEYEGKDAPSRARKLVQSGDTIFATVRPSLKRVAKIPEELDGHICSTAFCVIRANPDLADSSFVFFTVSADGFVERVSEQQRGSSYPAVADRDVLDGLVPLPPLNEQQEISRMLKTLDDKVAAEESRKQSLGILFETLLHNLMTGKVRVNDLDLSAVEEIA